MVSLESMEWGSRFVSHLVVPLCMLIVEWFWMQKDRESITPEERDDMARANEQNILDKAAGSVSTEECVLKQVFCLQFRVTCGSCGLKCTLFCPLLMFYWDIMVMYVLFVRGGD